MRENSGQNIKDAVSDLKKLHHKLKEQIVERLKDFHVIWERGSEEDIFAELAFCLLTPQSKAKSCEIAVGCLIEEDLLFFGTQSQIARALRGKTRFHNTKAGNIIRARKLFSRNDGMAIKKVISDFADAYEAREWLVNNIRGMGYKEASHFLRNIGMGEELAILDRHILKNLATLGIIAEIPGSLSKKRYLEIEDKVKRFAKNVKIPASHLDLLLWYKETGEIFK
ncbi:MAG: N-glycosylase/DNA lyase [Thermoplasmata archaeon]|nr:MAG: N-glycosylase/DNA lyase [Thermoplasmata archaeon]